MKKLVIGFVIVLSGCSSSKNLVFADSISPVQHAFGYIGLSEEKDRIAIAELTGVDPVETEWCAAYVNGVLAEKNIPNLNDIENTPPLLARSYLKWGTEVALKDIEIGDLVIFERGTEGWQGHVGFYVGSVEKTGELLILGGNQDNSVSIKPFGTSKLLGIRRQLFEGDLSELKEDLPTRPRTKFLEGIFG